jgi:hypothetical protein
LKKWLSDGMTLSVATREQFALYVLKTMASAVGLDQDYPSVHFVVSDPRFADVPPTTWIELKDYRRIKLVSGVGEPAYRLTGSGWVDGLKAMGILDSPELKDRALAVVKALKRHIDGRDYHHDPLIEIAFLSLNAGQTAEWCFNSDPFWLAEPR